MKKNRQLEVTQKAIAEGTSLGTFQRRNISHTDISAPFSMRAQQ